MTRLVQVSRVDCSGLPQVLDKRLPWRTVAVYDLIAACSAAAVAPRRAS